MKRWLMIKKLLPLALAGSMTFLSAAQAAEPILIGAAASKTGPMAGGAAVTYWPNVKLWEHEVNARGGLQMADGSKRPIRIIEYDDRTDPAETIRAVQRLATNDRADFILAPYSTGLALAAAPIFDRYGYPMVNVSTITDQTDTLSARYERIFFTLGKTSVLAAGVVDALVQLREAGEIGNRVALVNVADAFGIELAQAARPALQEKGFEIVFNRSYPLGTQDLTPVMRGAAAARPDAFVAFSYPPDTFALTELAQVENLDVKVFYTAVGTPFPSYKGRFGDAINGVMGVGGVNADSDAFQAYQKRHQEVTGQAPDFWASAVQYASFQVLEQAIEGVGGVDRAAVTDYIKNNTFQTVMGEWRFENQQIRSYWTVGQWQDGEFKGIASEGNLPGAVAPTIKNGWK
ncbi:amino acid ABC transporter substrate-binding protein [Marinospirillum alkaliphilum]|uniref:Amino acid/amide ABC transporter substrate-binding protein, HAAT family n=1 Tax=Marinospirillum alkaliphilum DSM 21637 TaxID=1122209 RepID=A0A1K1THC2_9GAMM|nr:amino acid ABC transporter substrate-binding protein [Marinospirillum alkaliphilum]SFW99685.1 amino acid/amide ABC transporter substrate-binding protein, HAAT family [Marinospirillum alkaliphilum DSM 21637]